MPAPIGPGSAGARAAATFTITGTVRTYLGVGLSGVGVVIANDCESVDPLLATDCAAQGNTTTTGGGAFTLDASSLASGPYWVYSNATSSWSGDAVNVTYSGSSLSGLELRVWPRTAYGNATIVLPNWNNLSAYANDGAGQGQVPIVSWTQDGVYYVDSLDRLVFYSFSNRTEYPIAASWEPLYQDFLAAYGAVNTEFITQDGSWIYTMGCGGQCYPGTPIIAEAVNVSTGRVFNHTFTDFGSSALTSNGEAQMVGLNGNSSILVATTETGVAYAWGLWNGTEWKLGTFNGFETNNNYWVPEIHAWITVQAGGATSDNALEYQLEGSGGDVWLEQVADVQLASPGYTPFNWANGVTFNITDREIAFGGGYNAGGTGVLGVFQVDGHGVLGAEVHQYLGSPMGAWPNNYVGGGNQIAADPYRVGIEDGAPQRSAWVDDDFYNASEFFNPFSGVWYSQNVTMGAPIAGPQHHQGGGALLGSPANWFFNATWGITDTTVECDHIPLWPCALEGRFPGTVPGTVWWVWQLGHPEFPYAPTAALTEPDPPLAPGAFSALAGPATTLQWTPAADAAHDVNYTLCWGPNPARCGNWTNLHQWNDSFTISGLPGDQDFVAGIEAWNLHWHSDLETVPFSTRQAAPTGLAFQNVSNTSFVVNWVNHGSPTSNEVSYGTSCALAAPTGGTAVRTTQTISVVQSGTSYCVDVTETGSLGVSRPIWGNLTLPPARPTNLTFTRITTLGFTAGWGIPSPVTNLRAINFSYGSQCDALVAFGGIGLRASQSVSSLAAGMSYCVEVTAATAGGSSSGLWGNVSLVPDAPTSLILDVPAPTSLAVSWTNPPGALEADQVAYGLSCQALSTIGGSSVRESQSIPDLSAGETYCVEITASTSGGTSTGLWGNQTLPESSGSSAVGGSFLGLPGDEGFLVLGVLVAAVAIAAGLVIRRRGRAPPPEEPPETLPPDAEQTTGP
ncbi:MAG TPA: fibronectin type III domain-containing protein [Thermoplasmata archaeon]|nr:fibronectin type III domain-containing protein [Thermoplasmata archaeon]